MVCLFQMWIQAINNNVKKKEYELGLYETKPSEKPEGLYRGFYHLAMQTKFLTDKQTHRQTGRHGWNSTTPFLQGRDNIKHVQVSQQCLEIWLNSRDSFIYLYVLKMADCFILIPQMSWKKRLIWKKTNMNKENKNIRYIHICYQNHRKVKSTNTNILFPLSCS